MKSRPAPLCFVELVLVWSFFLLFLRQINVLSFNGLFWSNIKPTHPSACLCVCGGERGHFRREERSRGVGSGAPARSTQQLWGYLLTFTSAFCLGLRINGKWERVMFMYRLYCTVLLGKWYTGLVSVVCPGSQSAVGLEVGGWRCDVASGERKNLRIFSVQMMKQHYSLFCTSAWFWPCWGYAMQQGVSVHWLSDNWM